MIPFLSTPCDLNFMVFEEYSLAGQFHLFNHDHLTQLCSPLVRIEHVVLTSIDKPSRAHLGLDPNADLPWIVLLVLLEVIVPVCSGWSFPVIMNRLKVLKVGKHCSYGFFRRIAAAIHLTNVSIIARKRPYFNLFGFSIRFTKSVFVDVYCVNTWSRRALSRSGIVVLKFRSKCVRFEASFRRSCSGNGRCTRLVNTCTYILF